jgi:hypothetical protein
MVWKYIEEDQSIKIEAEKVEQKERRRERDERVSLKDLSS